MADFKPYYLNPFEELDIDVPKSKRREALEAVSEFLKEQMLDYIGSGETPVNKRDGGKWVRDLSPEYLEKKKLESSVDFANLELKGDLLDSLTVEPVSSNRIVIDVGEDQYGKATGHLEGLYGANAKKAKPRVFMPQGDQRFRPDILEGVRRILEDFQEEE